MKKKKESSLPLILLGSTLLMLGVAAYLILSTRLEEEDIDFDLYDEDSDIYY
jgi:hypothetical protein